jgi:hypothetical protein
VESDGAGRPGPGRRGAKKASRGRTAAAITLVIAAGFAVLAPGAVGDEVVQPAPGVPGQERAWELVTPAEPMSAQLFGLQFISPNGSRIAYVTIGPLPDAPPGMPLLGSAFALRGANGWTNQSNPVPPFPDTHFQPLPLRISPDLGTVLWELHPPASGFVASLARRAPAGDTLLAENAALFDASTDLQHILFSSQEHLLAEDASRTSGASLYEAVGSGLRLVDVDSSGTLLSECGATTEAPTAPGHLSPISRDGRRIFFTTVPGCAGTTRAFMRVDGTTTVEIGASQCDLPDCGKAADIRFVGATDDGSSAYLLTAEKLLDADADSLPDLYRYDVGDGRLTLVSTDVAGRNLVATALQGGSSVGARAYFIAEVPELGESDLYMADDSGPHRVPGDSFFEASVDGRYVVYTTSAQLVAGDTDENADVYRYDAEQGATTLLSVSPTAGNGPFDAGFTQEAGIKHSSIATRYQVMSEDGSHVFFTTAEPLLPADRNQAGDVYEWTEGVLSLVSAGTGRFATYFLGSNPDGETVVFETADTLVAQDRDRGSWDFYAARIGGGFPPSTPAPAPVKQSAAPRADRAIPSRPGLGHRIGLARIDAAARREIVASGWIDLLAEVPGAGRLSAVARAKVGGRERVIASAGVRASEPGPLRLRMRLSKGARRRLAAGLDLKVQLRLHLSGLDLARRVGFALRTAR